MVDFHERGGFLTPGVVWCAPAGMGTAEARGSKSSAFYTRGDYIPGLKVDGMDVMAAKQAFAFAKEYALQVKEGGL